MASAFFLVHIHACQRSQLLQTKSLQSIAASAFAMVWFKEGADERVSSYVLHDTRYLALFPWSRELVSSTVDRGTRSLDACDWTPRTSPGGGEQWSRKAERLRLTWSTDKTESTSMRPCVEVPWHMSHSSLLKYEKLRQQRLDGLLNLCPTPSTKR
jgi:hypothetical protein